MTVEWHLLREYVERGSQAAFTELVERYLPLVYATALREVHNPVLAEDVSQVVFLTLSQKAASLPEGTVLAGWLFRTTRFVARHALRAETRRLQREQKAAEQMMHELQDITQEEYPAAWGAVNPLLHEALASLTAGDRDAVLLRYFDGRTLKETGLALGISEDAASKRVARAVERLRQYFLRRNVVISAAVLAVLLGEHAVCAVPAHCVNSVIQVTSGAAAGLVTAHGVAPQLLSTKMLSIWKGAEKVMFRTKVNLAAGLVVGTTLVAVLTVRSTGKITNAASGNNHEVALQKIPFPPVKQPFTQAPITWGVSRDGFALGLARLSPQPVYHFGETLSLSVYAGSTTSGYSRVTYDQSFDESLFCGSWAPVVTDQHGRPMRVAPGLPKSGIRVTSGGNNPGRGPLERGTGPTAENKPHGFHMGYAVLVIRPRNWEGPADEPTLYADPGTYTMTISYPVIGQIFGRGPVPPIPPTSVIDANAKPTVLTSAPLKFKIVAGNTEAERIGPLS